MTAWSLRLKPYIIYIFFICRWCCSEIPVWVKHASLWGSKMVLFYQARLFLLLESTTRWSEQLNTAVFVLFNSAGICIWIIFLINNSLVYVFGLSSCFCRIKSSTWKELKLNCRLVHVSCIFMPKSSDNRTWCSLGCMLVLKYLWVSMEC